MIAAATPRDLGNPIVVDECLEKVLPGSIAPGDIVGIGIHTGNALRGYEVGRMARQRGAWVVYGGIHATLYPDEAFEHGLAHSIVTGDGDLAWGRAVAGCMAGKPERIYPGGHLEGAQFLPARWDLMPRDKYMWASVQTTRGCPKHCSFCSVWRTDGQRPRQRPYQTVIDEIVALRRMGFRFIALADDNFYPVSFTDLRHAREQNNQARLDELNRIRADRFLLMEELARLPDDLAFFTQITMEAGEDGEYLDAMRKAHIKGALVGVESVTPEGLKAVYKDFNYSGDALATQLQTFKQHRVHVLGSFIFGLPTDKPATFDATAEVALKAGISFAQFVMLNPLPGTVDFARWEKEQAAHPTIIGGVPVTRYWLIPSPMRPKLFIPHPTMSFEEIRVLTQKVWDRFYSWRAIWRRADCTPDLRARLAFTFISRLYRQMYAGTGLATDSARKKRSEKWARWTARLCRRLFHAKPMPQLQSPVWEVGFISSNPYSASLKAVRPDDSGPLTVLR